MSNLMQTIKSRRSTRAFESKLPPKDQIMQFMATELGLGSCWINQIRECCDDSKVRSLLTEYGVPEDHIVICSAAIGYIAKETPAKPRKEGIVSFVE
ncbi:MAG TPA: nitroreductase family protein [Candidatus Agathobaculum pullicola]|nr:nitroreductase family protein [Candidatus Agathobaculum pullicola]